MDTSELLEKLQRRIQETTRDRDRLSEAVVALGGEVVRLESDQESLKRLISRFQTAEGSDLPESDRSRDSTYAPPVRGSAYQPNESIRGIPPAKEGLGTTETWAHYKLEVADWYLANLVEQPPSSVVSSALAIEGVILALCSSFDSAIYQLTRTVERAAEIPGDRQTPGHLATWSKLFAEARFVGIELASSLSISDALLGERSDHPQGWLAQLLMLRSRSTRESPMVNAEVGTKNQSDLMIAVPTQGTQPAIAYLTRSRDLVRELVETMFDDISTVERGEASQTRAHESREKAERDLQTLFSDR